MNNTRIWISRQEIRHERMFYVYPKEQSFGNLSLSLVLYYICLQHHPLLARQTEIVYQVLEMWP
jgi:hypothetical protein